jgi:xanthine/uracil permease
VISFPSIALVVVIAIIGYDLINMIVEDYRHITGQEAKTVSNSAGEIIIQYIVRIFIIIVCGIAAVLLR